MKKILLSLSLLFGAAILSAQVEFAPIGAVWHYHEYPFFYFPFAQIGYYQIESVADTVIQGRMCRKLIKNHPVLCTGEHIAEYVSHTFTIENKRAHSLYFDVLDGNGRALLRGQSAGVHSHIAIPTLPPGVYHVTFREAGRWIGTLKLLVVR